MSGRGSFRHGLARRRSPPRWSARQWLAFLLLAALALATFSGPAISNLLPPGAPASGWLSAEDDDAASGAALASGRLGLSGQAQLSTTARDPLEPPRGTPPAAQPALARGEPAAPAGTPQSLETAAANARRPQPRPAKRPWLLPAADRPARLIP
jgi:hypothetical protein